MSTYNPRTYKIVHTQSDVHAPSRAGNLGFQNIVKITEINSKSSKNTDEMEKMYEVCRLISTEDMWRNLNVNIRYIAIAIMSNIMDAVDKPNFLRKK